MLRKMLMMEVAPVVRQGTSEERRTRSGMMLGRRRRSEWRRRRGVAASPGTRWFRLTRGRSQLCIRSVFRIYVFQPDLIQLFLSQSVQDSGVDDWQAYQDPSFCSGKFSARSTSFGGLSNTRDENFSDFSKVPSFQVRSELAL